MSLHVQSVVDVHQAHIVVVVVVVVVVRDEHADTLERGLATYVISPCFVVQLVPPGAILAEECRPLAVVRPPNATVTI